MADNTVLNAGAGGDTIATDDIAGIKHQLVKIEFGAADSATQVSAAAPLPTDPQDRALRDNGKIDIAAFDAALPAGTNNIGDVDVLTLPALPAGTNNIGDVDVLTLPALPAGTNNIGDVDVLTLPALVAGTAEVGSVSLGVSTGKTSVMQTGQLVTTATTADQVVLTYTVTGGKTFYLEYLAMYARMTTYSTTGAPIGHSSLESPAGTKLVRHDGFVNAGTTGGTLNDEFLIVLAEPIPFAAGVVVRVVCTPAATTSMTWTANFGGYEK